MKELSPVTGSEQLEASVELSLGNARLAGRSVQQHAKSDGE